MTIYQLEKLVSEREGVKASIRWLGLPKHIQYPTGAAGIIRKALVSGEGFKDTEYQYEVFEGKWYFSKA